MNETYRAISTVFYAGYFPKFPGTFASAVAAVCWWLIPESGLQTQLSAIIIVTAIGIFTSGKTAEHLNIKDPSVIVIDEVTGMWISLFLLPKNLVVFICGFILFRILDIAKPLWINSAQNLPGGTGIMADDILAGIVTCSVLHVGLMIL